MMPSTMMPCRMPIRRIFSRMSPWRMWLNSWAMTPCSSSRDSVSMAPRVMPMTASPGAKPAAKALMADSSIRYTGGTGVPEAMAISSTTLSSRCSARVPVPGCSRRPCIISATRAPPPDRETTLYRLPKPTTARTATLISANRRQSTVIGTAVSASADAKPRAKNTSTLVMVIRHTSDSRNNTTSRTVLRRAMSWERKKSMQPALERDLGCRLYLGAVLELQQTGIMAMAEQAGHCHRREGLAVSVVGHYLIVERLPGEGDLVLRARELLAQLHHVLIGLQIRVGFHHYV